MHDPNKPKVLVMVTGQFRELPDPQIFVRAFENFAPTFIISTWLNTGSKTGGWCGIPQYRGLFGVLLGSLVPNKFIGDDRLRLFCPSFRPTEQEISIQHLRNYFPFEILDVEIDIPPLSVAAYTSKPIHNTHRLYYKISRATELSKGLGDFDFYCRIRPNIFIHKPVPIPEDSVAYADWVGSDGRCGDSFILVDARGKNLFQSIFSDYCQKGIDDTHKFLYHQLISSYKEIKSSGASNYTEANPRPLVEYLLSNSCPNELFFMRKLVKILLQHDVSYESIKIDLYQLLNSEGAEKSPGFLMLLDHLSDNIDFKKIISPILAESLASHHEIDYLKKSIDWHSDLNSFRKAFQLPQL